MEPHEIKKLVAETVKKETEALRKEVSSLKAENLKLWNMVTKMDRDMDTIEQYNRKSSLILGALSLRERSSRPQPKTGRLHSE